MGGQEPRPPRAIIRRIVKDMDMPTVSVFYGIIIRIYYDEHKPPHFHAYYQGYSATFDFYGDIICGEIPAKQLKLIGAWAQLHHDELDANWALAEAKESLVWIDPLR